MLPPLSSFYQHITGNIEPKASSLTNLEKISFVIAGVLALGAAFSAGGCFLTGFREWGLFSMGIVSISTGAWIFTAHTVTYHQLLEHAEFLKKTEKKLNPKRGDELKALKAQYKEIFNLLIQFDSKDTPESIKKSLEVLFYQDLSSGEIEVDSFHFFLALPYFFKVFYSNHHEVSKKDLAHILSHFFAHTKKNLFEDISIGKLEKKVPFFIDLFLSLLEPLAPCLEEIKAGKQNFLREYLNQSIFNGVPIFLEYQMKEIERKLQDTNLPALKCTRLEKEYRKLSLLKNILFPLLSQMSAKIDFSKKTLENYSKELLAWKNKIENKEVHEIARTFQDVNLKLYSFEPKLSDLPEFIQSINKLDDDFRKNLIKIVECLEKEAGSSAYKNFLKSFKKICLTSFEEIQSYFDEKETTGTLFAKSYLIGRQLHNLYSSSEKRHILITNFFRLLLRDIAAANIDTQILDKKSALVQYLQDSLNDTEFADKCLKLIPIQECIPLFLFILYSFRYLGEVRPFISNHSSLLSQIINDSEIELLIKHQTKIKVGVKLVLGLLAPVNLAITGAWPGKSFMIRKALSTAFSFFESQIKKENEREILQAAIPIILFAVLGVFGSNHQERKAFFHLEGCLKDFYKKLYSFDIEQAIKDPHFLSGHIEKVIDSLFRLHS